MSFLVHLKSNLIIQWKLVKTRKINIVIWLCIRGLLGKQIWATISVEAWTNPCDLITSEFQNFWSSCQRDSKLLRLPKWQSRWQVWSSCKFLVKLWCKNMSVFDYWVRLLSHIFQIVLWRHHQSCVSWVCCKQMYKDKIMRSQASRDQPPERGAIAV